MTTTSKTSGGAAKAAPSTPAEAERLIRKVSTAEEAHQLYLFCAVKEASWRAVKLKALRRYGELLGKAKDQPHTGRGHSVLGKHAISAKERSARREARKVAAVPQDVFDEYLRVDPTPTQVGLLHTANPAKNRAPKLRASKPKPTPAGKRMAKAKLARVTATRNGEPVAFWETGWQITRLVYDLAAWHVESVPLDYDNTNAMLSVEEDLLYLYDWIDETLSLIHSRIGEHGMRQTLRKLQAKTVENGCTPAEAEAARRAAARLQRKINNALAELAGDG